MKTIVITGASKGIGRATALHLSNQGHRVIAISRSEDLLNELKTEASAGEIITAALDLTSASDLELLEIKLSAIKTIDALIHNAGVLVNKPFMETTLEDWQLQLDVNLLAVVQLTKKLKSRLVEGSHIVNIGSMGGFQGSAKFPGLSGYSASKGAVSILTECLSTEFASDGIAVNCLCLGAVQTEMLGQAFPGYEAPLDPEDMGEFISDFTLNAHRFINGKILPIALNNPG
jgi:NAD(P)-dependent dehydrogenase (short-subunit alcohol dehydrogenase family)